MKTKPKQESTVYVMVEEKPPRPLSPGKTQDILRAAKRIMSRDGVVLVSEVYAKCRPRIPGSVERYAASLLKLGRNVD